MPSIDNHGPSLKAGGNRPSLWHVDLRAARKIDSSRPRGCLTLCSLSRTAIVVAREFGEATKDDGLYGGRIEVFEELAERRDEVGKPETLHSVLNSLRNKLDLIMKSESVKVEPAVLLAVHGSLSLFTRATVRQDGSYSFDVWRVPEVTVKGRQALQQLRSLAEEHLRGWKHEGDPEVEIESTEFPMLDGRIGLSTFVRFYVGGNMNHAVANWFVDHDGTVFRICAAGSLSRSREELTKVVNEITSTWRRLAGDTKTSSKWWNLLSR